jgi:hypothetical protein
MSVKNYSTVFTVRAYCIGTSQFNDNGKTRKKSSSQKCIQETDKMSKVIIVTKKL